MSNVFIPQRGTTMFSLSKLTQIRLNCGPERTQDYHALQEELNNQGQWYENFYFENGASTPGRSPSPKKLLALGLPNNLSNVQILDVGAYEGYYSIHCEQRGAEVIANDFFIWNLKDDNSRSNFELIKKVTGSKIKTLESPIAQLPIKKSDITLFLGVLYHVEDQIETLRMIRDTAKSLVILETLVDALDQPGPNLRYYPGNSLNGDITNQFGPNLEALQAMISQSGYRSWELKSMWEFNTIQGLNQGNSLDSPLRSGRVVYWLYP